ncbi:biopolymer transport protein ExbD/TolR [Microseira wollei NIES-4236]|uniref:Biopolymer transport protein ExbD/TolR n=1 Tax=Microseira wollei NIES-4236 TaxID=2530354 RepID=A0AAV3WGP7_9CYAN|nr:biopolymer transport protein ExbD/TolR [Microseira wollei NIES-4236]
MTVTIDSQGELAVNRESIGLEALEGAVQKLRKPDQELLIVLNADKAVNHGQVVQVMDKLRRIEGAKLAIATQKP